MLTVDWDEARRIAASYPESARFVPFSDRKRHLNRMQRFAWALRFEPDTADPELFFRRDADIPSAELTPETAANSCRFVRDGRRPNAEPNI